MDHRPLILTDDDSMLEELLRVAAAAGVEVDHGLDPGARAPWRSATAVLIDTELVPAAVAARMPIRSGVIGVSSAEPDGPLLKMCIRLGLERTVTLGEEDGILIDLLSGTRTGGPGDGRTVAVIGACGGAGASVLAAALAGAAERSGLGVVLADCDPWGQGLDVLLGIEQHEGLRWEELAAPSGRLPSEALHRALPAAPLGHGRVAVLCHGRSGGREVSEEVVDVIVESGRRAGDLTIVDLPRYPSPAGDRVIEKADLVVLVTTADVRGCFAAARVAERLFGLGVTPELVVRGPSPGGIGADDIGAVIGAPVLARMRPQPFLARDLEVGRPPGTDRRGPLAKAAGTILARLTVGVG